MTACAVLAVSETDFPKVDFFSFCVKKQI